MTDLKEEGKQALEDADSAVASWIGSHSRMTAWIIYGLVICLFVAVATCSLQR